MSRDCDVTDDVIEEIVKVGTRSVRRRCEELGRDPPPTIDWLIASPPPPPAICEKPWVNSLNLCGYCCNKETGLQGIHFNFESCQLVTQKPTVKQIFCL